MCMNSRAHQYIHICTVHHFSLVFSDNAGWWCSRKITFYMVTYCMSSCKCACYFIEAMPHIEECYTLHNVIYKACFDAMHAQDEGRVPGGLDGEWCPWQRTQVLPSDGLLPVQCRVSPCLSGQDTLQCCCIGRTTLRSSNLFNIILFLGTVPSRIEDEIANRNV